MSNLSFDTPYAYQIITTASELGVEIDDILAVTISNWSGLLTTIVPFYSQVGNIGLIAGEPGTVGMVELLIALK